MADKAEKWTIEKSHQKKRSKTLGPVDYLVLGFPGNKFNGKIAPELERLEKNGTIRIIDMVFIHKDIDGKVEAIELKDMGGETGDSFGKFAGNVSELLSLDDIDSVGASLPMNSSAAILLYENTWAIRFKEALIGSEAMLITQGRVPAEVIAMVSEEKQKYWGD
jgi:hypothetical protein